LLGTATTMTLRSDSVLPGHRDLSRLADNHQTGGLLK
jgi:hypothetical protein